MENMIDKLAAMIADEMEGAAKYAQCAMKHKQERPKLAEMFHEMAAQEMEHMKKLHAAAEAELKAMQEKYEEA